MKRRRAGWDTAALGLDTLDEALSLLRELPAAAWMIHGLGFVPFFLAALFFWSDMSTGVHAASRCAGEAGFLALTFVWMKTCQARFGTFLTNRLSGLPEGEPPSAGWSWLGVAHHQLVWQPVGFLLLPLAMVLMLPLGWAWAFHQNLVILDDGRRSSRELGLMAWRQARYAPTMNHSLLMAGSVVAFVVWLNLALAAAAVPWALKLFLGMETVFVRAPFTYFNTLFFWGTLLGTWGVLDPWNKAAYAIRCFRGQSQASGEDLLARWDRQRSGNRMLPCIMLVLCFSGDLTARGMIPAEPGPDVRVEAVPGQLQKVELDQALDEVLNSPRYLWKQGGDKREAETEEAEVGGFAGFLKQCRLALEGAVKWVVEGFGDLFKGLGKLIEDLWNKLSGGKPKPATPTAPSANLWLLLQGLTVLAGLGLVGWSVWLLWRRFRPATVDVPLVEEVATVPDLAREDLVADVLPEDEWLRLAAECLARGEFRLALRGYYLAALAHLASRNLLVPARYKSNRDYEREIGRRARDLGTLPRAFSNSVLVFDRVWYGDYAVDQTVLDEFRGYFEEMRAC